MLAFKDILKQPAENNQNGKFIDFDNRDPLGSTLNILHSGKDKTKLLCQESYSKKYQKYDEKTYSTL